MNGNTNLMAVVFAFPMALALLLQGGSCSSKKSEPSNPASVKPEKAATNRNRSTVEGASSKRDDAVERVAANDNQRKDDPGMKQADVGGGASRERRSAVETGIWGGAHIRLQVSASGAEVEYDCGHGTIEKMTLDGDGRFDVRGTHTRERGGPVRLGEEANRLPARYIGKVEGQTMTLRVTLDEAGEEVGAFNLTQGRTARLVKCL